MKQLFIMLTSGVGTVCLSFFAALLCANAFDAIKGFIRRKKYEHKRKCRFDKPPIAKCYCIDCIHAQKINEDRYRCTLVKNNHLRDDWFCADGIPREEE